MIKMNNIIIIPARYKSTRLPGKPLVDICGKPMLWWVYQETKKVKNIDDIVVATEDERVLNYCKNNNIKALLTSDEHITHIDRIHEVSEKIKAQNYIIVCGDEALLDYKSVEKLVINNAEITERDIYVKTLYRKTSDMKVIESLSNIKVLINDKKEIFSFSRLPIPYNYKQLDYSYNKLVGIESFNKKALDFFVSHKESFYEKVESITLFRFIENGVNVLIEEIDNSSISVDTTDDLEYVRNIIKNRT